jgi:hypothetical protein
MDKPEFDTYVTDRYEGQMKYYKETSAKNQKMYKRFQWILIILSALTPVFAALKGIRLGSATTAPTVDLNILVLVVSSLVAILTTGLKTFNYQELWINARSTYEKLKPEIHYYHFNAGPYGVSGVDKESLFVTRVEVILDTEHKQWPPAKTLQDKDGKPDKTTADPKGKK